MSKRRNIAAARIFFETLLTGRNRPRAETSIDGLRLASAYYAPGGLDGAIAGGAAVARAVLLDVLI